MTFDEVCVVARSRGRVADSRLPPPEDAKVTRSRRALVGTNGDFYVRASYGDEAHQAVSRELLQAPADDVGNPGLVGAEHGSSLNLG
jgi:hypothetical protein